jgi:ParB-like chromosome segregation protein Spo0J
MKMDTETDTQSETNEGGTTPPDDASTTAPELLGDRAKLEMIQIDRLDAHPQNPRIGGLREDVVSAIEVSVRADGFKRYFAGIGRTKSDGRTEILKGHHQTEGARRAGLKAIPMWIVNEITDEEALRLLAFSNAQGELTPLEIALASFAVVPAKGRKGLGLAEFASRMGVKPPNLTRYRRGVEVYRALVDSGTSDDIIKGCRDRAEHLAVIKGADPGRWPELVDQCVHGRWSIDETKAQVRRDDQKE